LPHRSRRLAARPSQFRSRPSSGTSRAPGCTAESYTAYATLVEAHRGLAAEASVALNTRLVLILANHIGELDVLQEAIALAKGATRQVGT